MTSKLMNMDGAVKTWVLVCDWIWDNTNKSHDHIGFIYELHINRKAKSLE